MTKLTTTLFLCGISSVAAFAIVAQATRHLVIDGTNASDNVIQKDGRYWVPVDDMARYFGYSLTVDQNGATMTRVGSKTTGGGQTPVPQTAPVGTIVPGTADPNVQPPNLGNGPTVAPAAGVPMTGAAQQFANSTYTTQTQPAPPTQIKVGIGQDASVGGFDYRVDDIRPVGSRYKEQFDQRGRTVHPRFKSDSLVVLDIQETNRGTQPFTAYIPEPSQISVFGKDGVGYEASFADVRQSEDVVDGSWASDYDMYQEYNLTAGSISLAPGGTLRFAVVASVPSNDPIESVSLSLNGTGSNGSPSDTIVTVGP